MTHADHVFVSRYLEPARVRLGKLATRLVGETQADAVVEDAAARFLTMLPEMPYLDDPDHPMAASAIITGVNLALFLAVRERGIDAHDFGAAMLTGLARAPAPPAGPDVETIVAVLDASARASNESAAPGEFVFDILPGDGESDWGMEVRSCAVCSMYARYDAMTLVPYMCATDDVMSDKGDEGLRRTGSIALGASSCDFRYKSGGEPARLAAQYPDQIRVVPAGDAE